MPTYEYECTECGYSFEVFQSMSDEPLKTCSRCGKKVRRLIFGGAGVIFKGSGFYVTDKAAGKGKGQAAKADKSESKPSSSKGDAASAGVASSKGDAASAGVASSKGDAASVGGVSPKTHETKDTAKVAAKTA